MRDDDPALEGLSDVAKILKTANKDQPLKGLGYAPKRVKDMRAANSDIKRILKTMVDPTKLSLVQLQEELARRGLRPNAGTLGNRYQLVGRLQLDNLSKATEIAERGLPEEGMEWAVKKTLLDKWRDDQAANERAERLKKWTDLKVATQNAKYPQALKIAQTVDPDRNYKEQKLSLLELKDAIYKILDGHLKQVNAEELAAQEALRRYSEYWQEKEAAERGEVFVKEDDRVAEMRKEKKTLRAAARAALAAMAAADFAAKCVQRATDALAGLRRRREEELRLRELRPLPPIVWNELTLTVAHLHLKHPMPVSLTIEMDDSNAACKDKVCAWACARWQLACVLGCLCVWDGWVRVDRSCVGVRRVHVRRFASLFHLPMPP